MSFPLIFRGRDPRRAFTLIELLTVMAIVGVLAALTFGVSRGVFQQSRISRAKAELATLASALENYKKYYGDYPMVHASNETADNQIDPKATAFTAQETDRAYNFFRALCGYLGPKQTPNERRVTKLTTKIKYGKSFISPSAFALERSDTAQAPAGKLAIPTPDVDRDDDDPDFSNALLDPWGNRYLYYYIDLGAPNSWKQPSYILYSAGPDGLATFPTVAGEAPPDSDIKNADNIYAKP